MQNTTILDYIKSKINRKRTMAAGVAIVALVAVVAFAAVNANATPRSNAELQMAGWVNELKTDKLTTERQLAQQQIEKAGEAAVPQLLTALRSENSTQRINASDMLGYIASPQATDALRTALHSDTVPAVRRNAAYALGEIKAASTINDLQEAAITDKSEMVRASAADSLARIRTAIALTAKVNNQFVTAFASAPSASEMLYVAAKRDLLTSRDGGKTWGTATNALPSQVSALAVSPSNPQVIYAGAEAMGIFKSTDGGKTWNAVNNGITLTPGAREAISAIAIDPNDSNVIYVAHGVWLGTSQVEFYPMGLVSSRDGGMTWQTLSTGTSATTGEQAIANLAFRDGQLYGLAGNRVMTLVTPR